MIQPGFETTDARTGTRTLIEEADPAGWVLRVHCPEGAPPAIPEHYHSTWTETFEVLSGSAAYRLGGAEHALFQGERATLPPGVPHVHPWNAGTGEMVYRQRNDFGAPDPTAARDVIGAFSTMNELARRGKVNRKGLPRNPLQLAATLRVLIRHGGYDASVPAPAQQLVAATLGRLAGMLGYRGVDPRFDS